MTQFNVNVSCYGKIAWSSVREAQRSLKHRYRKPVPVGKRNDGHTTLYRCKICRNYHVGGGPEVD